MTLGSFLLEWKSEILQILSLNIDISSRIFLIILKVLAKVSYDFGRHYPTQSHERHAVDDQEFVLLIVKQIQNKLDLLENAVIIPAFVKNICEVRKLERAVSSIQQQVDLVLVIDDASPISFPVFGKSFIYRLHVNSGPAAARNVGLDICSKLGIDHVLFMDADCVADEHWGSIMLNILQNGSMAVGGVTKSVGIDYISLYHDVFGTLNGRLIQNEKLIYTPTCNFGINQKCGIRFDEHFPDSAFEDIDFCIRLRKTGYEISFEPLAVINHDYNVSWDAFCKQFKKYGMSEWLFLRNHPEYSALFIESKEIASIKMF